MGYNIVYFSKRGEKIMGLTEEQKAMVKKLVGIFLTLMNQQL